MLAAQAMRQAREWYGGQGAQMQQQLANPRFKTWKTYLVQVENIPEEARLQRLRDGLELKDGATRPAEVKTIAPPDLWPREPPVRFRKNIPTQWLEIRIREGRNRQVRRMTAAIDHPTLRLVRTRIGKWRLGKLPPGEWLELETG